MSACSYMEHDGGGGSDGFGCSIVILHGLPSRPVCCMHTSITLLIKCDPKMHLSP